MIKGWRNNPDWRSYYANRADAVTSARQLQEILDVQQKSAEAMAKFRQEQREHMARCHADKLANGEIVDDHSKLN